MKRTTHFLPSIALLGLLFFSCLALSSCGETAPSGEVIETEKCSVFLPAGWTHDGNSSLLRKENSSNNEYVEIKGCDPGHTENYVSISYDSDYRLYSDKSKPFYRALTLGEDTDIAGITFKTFVFEDEPQYSLYGMRSGVMLEIEVANMDLSDPTLAAIIESIEPIEVKEKTPSKDESQEAEKPKDNSDKIEDGLPLTLVSGGKEYVITDLSWSSVISNNKSYYGVVVTGRGFDNVDVFPLRCEVVRNGTVSEPELMANDVTLGQTAFVWSMLDYRHTPDTVVIWPADNPNDRHTFTLK